MRVLLIVFWTVVLVLGIGIAALVSIPNLADLVQGASNATVAAKSAAVAAAVAMFILGLWGITSSHRAMKHTVGLLAEVDRARKETIQLESSRFSQYPK
jgi:hydrogenase-4 membrane subunit HyfE